ncbi:uncharacterized protein LOC121865562 [Homarus americanus]|uniref:uncharacterized protein LOC121865562 n=1 Tax=Homarus americanus TaxID=6706 RepID=UPI001C469938|nr:uncharacterized protein LOC121865562 [Homarus americanus]XP_042221013.1 uncharacterized protein LOC121865562 [Homarus americanus]
MEGLGQVPEDMIFSFSDLTQIMVDRVTNSLRQSQPAGDPRFIIPFFSSSGGCNDAFSGFGFLAFLLALLDLILELQNNTGTRRRREAGDWSGGEDLLSLHLEDPRSHRAAAACYSMYRGFLNALSTTDGDCAKRFLCEGAEEAASTGKLGQMIANVASVNAATWLTRENATRYKGTADAGLAGAAGAICAVRFSQCFSLPSNYQYPIVYTGDPLTDYRTPGIHDDL